MCYFIPDEELAATSADLFIAGTETTTTTLLWCLPLLASHPDIQTRMFDEIEKNVGTERLPAVQDKVNLVYVEAFYMEILRYASHITLHDMLEVVFDERKKMLRENCVLYIS